MSARFFQLDAATKSSLAWTVPEANRGYSAPGREKVSQLTDSAAVKALRSTVPDMKESFEIGRDDEPQHPNHWPPETGTGQNNQLVGFQQTMLDFCSQLKSLHAELMRAIAVGMALPDERYFDRFVCDGDNTLRLLHYPAVRRDLFQINPGQVRAGEHSDYGSITFLFQDDRGGLQVKSPEGRFVDATPIEGTCVVNAGDLLARWSNDTIKSTVHRVVEPPQKKGEVTGEGETYPPRYSIA
jgi:isopenicillin N synthase-like dioxygenase